MEQCKEGEQHRRRQSVIDDMLGKANKKAAEILGRKAKLPEEKLRPVVDVQRRPAEAEFEHAEGIHIVGKEGLAGDDQSGDKADRWLDEHDPEHHKGGEAV